MPPTQKDVSLSPETEQNLNWVFSGLIPEVQHQKPESVVEAGSEIQPIDRTRCSYSLTLPSNDCVDSDQAGAEQQETARLGDNTARGNCLALAEYAENKPLVVGLIELVGLGAGGSGAYPVKLNRE